MLTKQLSLPSVDSLGSRCFSFGLADAPSFFQKITYLVMAGLTCESCLVYVDNIIVFADTFERHIHRLEQVFQRQQ